MFEIPKRPRGDDRPDAVRPVTEAVGSEPPPESTTGRLRRDWRPGLVGAAAGALGAAVVMGLRRRRSS